MSKKRNVWNAKRWGNQCEVTPIIFVNVSWLLTINNKAYVKKQHLLRSEGKWNYKIIIKVFDIKIC